MSAVERLAAAIGRAWPRGARFEDADDAAQLVAADPDLAADIEFGAAWRRAEAALPEGHRIDLMWPYATQENPTWRYHASARKRHDYLGYVAHNDGGPTPTAALTALAEKLEAMK